MIGILGRAGSVLKVLLWTKSNLHSVVGVGLQPGESGVMGKAVKGQYWGKG